MSILTTSSEFWVSVIIPFYNVENYIRRAIESVLLQPEVMELILVDDGSSDKSLTICQEIQETDSRIIIINHPGRKNKGVAASRNLGIRKAKNEYVAFLDADDYYLANRFKETSKCFAIDEKTEAVYEMTGLQLSNKAIVNYSVIEKVNHDELFENLQPIGEKVWFHIDGLTVKRSIFQKAGFFDESLQTSEDTLQWFKMSAVARLVAGNIDYPVSIAVRRSDSLTKDIKLVQKDFISMLYALFMFCKQLPVATSRKEFALTKLLYFSTMHDNTKYHGFSRMILFFKVFLIDPVYVLFHSQSFRKYFGDMVGYNRLLYLLKRQNI